MTRSLEAVQSARVARTDLHVITLVKLTTYTDVLSKTGAYTFWLSDKPCIYDYGNTDTDRDFWPVFATASDLARGCTHVPSPDDVSPYSGGTTLTFSNQEFDGRRLFTILNEKNIRGAEVEVSQVAVDALTPRNDLTAMDGDEHTVLFTGEALRFGKVTQEAFDIDCRVTMPSLANHWVYGRASTVDPLDTGKRLPTVYGTAEKVPCVGLVVGWVTTLLEEIDDIEDDVAKEVTSTEGLPDAGTFILRMGDEEIECSKEDAGAIKIEAGGRAENSTTATAHGIGDTVLELVTSAIYAVAGHPVNAVDALYVMNPINNILHRVTTAFTTTLSDRTTEVGKNIATVSFTMAELTLLIDELIAAGIDTQPEFEDAAGESILVPFTSGSAIVGGVLSPFLGTTIPRFSDFHGESSPIGAWVKLDVDALVGTDDGGHYWIGSVSQSTRDVARWRLIYGWFYHANASVQVKMVWNMDFYGTNTEEILTIALGVTETQGVTTGSWHTESGNTVGDILRSVAPTADSDSDFLAVYLDTSTGGSGDILDYFTFDIARSFVEIEMEPQALTRTTDVTAGAAVGFGLRFFADVQGYKAPGDSIDPTATPAVLDAMDSSSGDWTATGCTDADESTEVFEGAGSLKVTSTATAIFSVTTVAGLSSEDWTDKAVVFHLYLTQATYDALVAADASDAIQVWISTTANFSNHLKKFDVDLYKIQPDTWTELQVTTNDVEADEVGTFDVTDVNAYGIRFVQDTATSGRILYIDNVRLVDSERIYSVAHGALIEHPADALTHWVEEVGREQIARTERTSAVTNLGSNKIAGDVRALGLDWPTIAQGLAYAARSNLMPEDTTTGREWRILTPTTAFLWPTPSEYITEGTLEDLKREDDEVSTHFNFRYFFDGSLDGQGEELFKSVVVANPTTSDVSVTASELDATARVIGNHEASPLFFRMIADEATAEDVAGYLVQESSAYDRSVFTIENIPWNQGYKLQVGDIIWATPPWQKFPDEQIFSFDSQAGDWTGINASNSNNATTVKEGAGSIRLNDDGITTDNGMKQDTAKIWNLRDRAVSVWLRGNAPLPANLAGVQIFFGSTADFADDWVRHDIDHTLVTSTEWNQFRIDVNANPDASSGSYDPARTIAWKVNYDQTSATGTDILRLDDMRVGSRRVACRIISYQKSFANEHVTIVAVQVPTV